MGTLVYPFDSSGTLASNKVTNEQQIIPTDDIGGYLFLIPFAAPFFKTSMKIYHIEKKKYLVEGVDFAFTHFYKTASVAIGKAIYGSITFYDVTLTGAVQLQYQTIGGEWLIDHTAALELMINKLLNPRITYWESVVDAPATFPVIEHAFNVVDLVGMADVKNALQAISLAINAKTSNVPTLMAEHIIDYNNPHRMTKAHIDLGNVFNYGIATVAQAEAGQANDAYMTPLRTKEAVVAIIDSDYGNHFHNQENPHGVNKTQVGLGKVQNYAIATLDEALTGTLETAYMTPYLVGKVFNTLVEEKFGSDTVSFSSVNSHIIDVSNPHKTNKAQLGLGNVLNYGLATESEAIAGIRNDAYMTPSLVRAAAVSIFNTANDELVNALDAHRQAVNPHNITKSTVQLDNVQNYAVATNAEALAGTATDKYVTPALVKAFFDNNSSSAIKLDANLHSYYGNDGELAKNTTGVQNIAIGKDALSNSTVGDTNVAIGAGTMLTAVGASGAVAIGNYAMSNVGSDSQKWDNTNVAVGAAAMYGSDDASLNIGNGNTAVGTQALLSYRAAYHNVAVGQMALTNNTDGQYHVAIGLLALGEGAVGSQSVAIGAYSQRYSQMPDATSNQSVSIGYSALAGDSSIGNTGSDNTAVGHRSLENNSTGSYNVAIGASALRANTTGVDNIAIGAETLIAHTEGSSNVAVGGGALSENTTGCENVAIGAGAAYSNTDSHNVAVGCRSLSDSVTGSYNVAVGVEAGKQSTGSNNVFVGACTAMLSTSTGSDVTCVGTGSGSAITDGEASTFIGACAGSTYTIGKHNVAVGYFASINRTSGVYNVNIGDLAGGYTGTLGTGTGDRNINIGQQAGLGTTNYSGTIAIGTSAVTTGDNQAQIGNSLTTTYVFGTVQNRSDIRDKADIADSKLGIDFILGLRAVEGVWNLREDYKEHVTTRNEDGTMTVTTVEHKNDGSKKRNRKHQWFIAQEVKALCDRLGVDFGGYQDHSINGGGDVLSLGYDEFIPPTVKAVQQCWKRLDEIELRVMQLEEANIA